MVEVNDFISVAMTEDEMRQVRSMARKAEIGGVSNIRDGGDRQIELGGDQLTGNMCEAAGSKWLFGSIIPYVASRAHKNLSPKDGDGGYDPPGLKIDIKGSSSTVRPLIEMNLVMPLIEWYPGHLYIAAFIQKDPSIVFLTGWALAEDLEYTANFKNKYGPRKALAVSALRPMADLTSEVAAKQWDLEHFRTICSVLDMADRNKMCDLYYHAGVVRI